MASAVVRLLESPDLANRIAHNAYDQCPAYTWAAVRETWLGFYTRLAGKVVNVSRSEAAGVFHSGPL